MATDTTDLNAQVQGIKKPAAPVERMIDRVERDLGGRTEKEIPVEAGRPGLTAVDGRRDRLVQTS